MTKTTEQSIPTVDEVGTIAFTLTLDQAETIAKAFDKELQDLDTYEVCEMLDKIIDNISMQQLKEDW